MVDDVYMISDPMLRPLGEFKLYRGMLPPSPYLVTFTLMALSPSSFVTEHSYYFFR